MSIYSNGALSGGNNSVIGLQEKVAYIDKLQVQMTNLLNDAECDRNAVGQALAFLLNSYVALPMDLPVTATSSGLVITVGQPGQRLYLQGRLIDNITTQTFTVPTADPSQTRIDAICAKYVLTPLSGQIPNQNVNQLSGPDVSTPINVNTNGIQWIYQVGVPGSFFVTPPSGYEAIFHVSTPPAGTVCTVTPIIENAQQLLGLASSLKTSTTFYQNGVNSPNILTSPVRFQGGDLSYRGSASIRGVLNSSSAVNGGTASGTITFSGDGTTTSFVLATGLFWGGITPDILTTPFTAAAAAPYYITWDTGNQITFHFLTAPVSGANNIGFQWRATYGTIDGINPDTALPQTIEKYFSLQVTPGAGAQLVGGFCITNCPLTVFLDAVATSGVGPEQLSTWAVTIPDDGVTHTLVFHWNTPRGPINAELGAWVPGLFNTGWVNPQSFAFINPL
jgi:hypothetical protein